jgi:hypothetical protein
LEGVNNVYVDPIELAMQYATHDFAEIVKKYCIQMGLEYVDKWNGNF